MGTLRKTSEVGRGSTITIIFRRKKSDVSDLSSLWERQGPNCQRSYTRRPRSPFTNWADQRDSTNQFPPYQGSRRRRWHVEKRRKRRSVTKWGKWRMGLLRMYKWSIQQSFCIFFEEKRPPQAKNDPGNTLAMSEFWYVTGLVTWNFLSNAY